MIWLVGIGGFILGAIAMFCLFVIIGSKQSNDSTYITSPN